MILAGGEGSRLGLDKATLAFQGVPLLHRQAQFFQDLGVKEIIVAVGRRRPLPLPPGVVVVEDRYPGLGPLAGLHAGLAVAHSPLCLVVACDMPFHVPSLAQELLRLEGALVKVCMYRGFLEPFPGVYSKQLVSALEERLARQQLSVQEFIRSIPHALIPEERLALLDPQGHSFLNLNTWETLARCTKCG